MRFLIAVLFALLFTVPVWAQPVSENQLEVKPVTTATIRGTEYYFVPSGAVAIAPDDAPIHIGINCIDDEKKDWLYLKKTCAWENEILPLPEGFLVLGGGVDDGTLEFFQPTGWGIFGIICMLAALMLISKLHLDVIVVLVLGGAFGAGTIVLGYSSLSYYGDNLRIAAVIVAMLTLFALLRQRRYIARFLAVLYIALIIAAIFLP